jgi:hypothetical protein
MHRSVQSHDVSLPSSLQAPSTAMSGWPTRRTVVCLALHAWCEALSLQSQDWAAPRGVPIPRGPATEGPFLPTPRCRSSTSDPSRARMAPAP